MKQILIFFILCLIYNAAEAQEARIEGKVTDESQNPLPYTNIRVNGTSLGTSANREGEYEIKLNTGSYKLIASYIGYISDTIEVNAAAGTIVKNFILKLTSINLPEITVLPGENPALVLIRKAIARKNRRIALLNSYEYKAYTKGIIRTEGDISAGNNSVGISTGGNDTIPLKISGIIENESKGYFKRPDEYKEIILARKQTSNFPPSINVLTGGRLIQNFYDETVNFLGEDLPGPLADNAPDYYYYYIENTLAIDNTTVYKIHISPDDSHDPGFTGSIYITEKNYDLIRVDLNLNRAANTGGIFDTVSVYQQFSVFSDSLVMPVDYRLYVTANYLNIVRFGFELSTILYDYKINPELPEKLFDKAVIKVIPDADERDSTYWKSIQVIPGTPEEKAAYKRIDSLESIPKSFPGKFSLLSPRLSLTDNIEVSAPLSMYRFNKVEGHVIDYGIFLNEAMKKRLNGSFDFSYGFSDKKIKESLSLEYLLGDYRTYSIAFKAFNNLKVLFGESDQYGDLLSSLLSLITKYDFRNYYYTDGFDFMISGEIFPVLSLNAGFRNHTDKSAVNNSNFSFFNRNDSYSPNQAIYETRLNTINAGFTFDFRDYIEDGYFRRRISLGRSYVILNGSIELSDKKILKSGLDFTRYKLVADGTFRTVKSGYLQYRLLGIYSKGSLPYQSLYALPGNLDLLFQDLSFRTLQLNEIFGSSVVTLNLEHNFGDLIFRALRVPGLMDWDIQLNTFFNAAYTEIGQETSAILPVDVKAFKHPFYELGFGLSQVLVPLEIEFAWRLNYRGENNFRVGIISHIL